MSLFNRKGTDSTPADPAMTEKGREYAIAVPAAHPKSRNHRR
ncbi:hypothetical protein [Streptomyces sp. NPDC101150]